MGNWFYILLGILAFIFGGMMVLHAFKTKNTVLPNNQGKKNGLPLIPRHLRQPLEQVEPTLMPTTPITVQADEAIKDKITIVSGVGSGVPIHNDSIPNSITPQTNEQLSDSKYTQNSSTISQNPPTQNQPIISTTNDSNSNANNSNGTHTNFAHNNFSANVDQFDESTPDFDDDHFDTSLTDDVQNNAILFNHTNTLTLMVSPKNNTVIQGTTIMNWVRQYGLKYGAINLFHRHKEPDGTGVLWFSIMAVDDNGLQEFDLVALPQAIYNGLAMVLWLPNPQAVQGFDSMTQIAYDIAQQIDGEVYDDSGYLLDQNQLYHLRAYIANYNDTNYNNDND